MMQIEKGWFWLEKEELVEYAKKVYGTEPECLWKQYPDYAVLRMQDTKK